MRYSLLLCFLFTSFGILFAQSTTSEKTMGYKGIWFTLGQFSDYGDKYSGGLGTYTAKHIPLAIYVPQVQKTFFVYGGTTASDQRHLLCMIGTYDHRSHTVTQPTVVHDKQGVDDPHDNPSLALDAEGYLWVFVSGRGRSRMGYKYRSTQPYDASAFTLVREEEMTYPQPKYISGRGFLHLFTKYTGLRELYMETSRDGQSWSDDRKLAGIKRPKDAQSGHYQISGQRGDTVAFFYNWHPNGNVDLRTNIYYMQTADFGQTWTNVKGEELSLPVSEVNNPGLVKEFFSQELNVYIKDMGYDAQGYPVALYLAGKGHQPGPTHGLRQWYVAHWNGSQWGHSPITTSDHNYDTGSLWIRPNEWVAIFPSEAGPQPFGAGGEVVVWKSADQGKTWRKARLLTRQSARNHNYIRRVVSGQDPFLYFWADGNPAAMSESHLYFGDRKGRVWELPYHMTTPTARPKRVR
jgi:hypothetical protein